MKIKQIILGTFFSFSMLFALNLNDLRQIQGFNPTPYELNNYILKKCNETDIPPIILKAILLKEGQSNHKWQQYSPDGQYNHESIVYGTDRASYGLGLFQITYKIDNNGNFLSGYSFNEIKRIVSDWKFNVDMAITKLLIKWRANVGSMTGVDSNPLIIENWYYPIAWYNGSGHDAKLYVDNVYKYMKDINSVIEAVGNSRNSDTIINYYHNIPNISDPYIISSFRGDDIRGSRPQVYTLEDILNSGGELHIWDKSNNHYKIYGDDNTKNHTNGITRAKALTLILDKFEISTKNAGFNSSRFGKEITLPSDVNQNTNNYNAIVVGYNRGITNGENGKFYPTRKVSLEEFITMIVRTIPIPLDNPNYSNFSYADSNDDFYKYLKAGYNAKILENKSYDFDEGIDESRANSLLKKAFDYFRGDKSGISIYLKWDKKYVDFDMYAYSPADSSNIQIEKDSNGYITNMRELNSYNNLLYYVKYSTSWGANLDYDSWGGNENQPWAGFGEERATVDSLMVKRPGKYSFIICYYDWGNSQSPSRATYKIIGYRGAKNITQGGSLSGTINKGMCKVGGTLTTN